MKEKERERERERFLYMNYQSKINEKNSDGNNIKKKVYNDFDKFDMVTKYIENEFENNPKMKNHEILKIKKFNTFEYGKDEIIKNKLYKIPGDFRNFLKKK